MLWKNLRKLKTATQLLDAMIIIIIKIKKPFHISQYCKGRSPSCYLFLDFQWNHYEGNDYKRNEAALGRT